MTVDTKGLIERARTASRDAPAGGQLFAALADALERLTQPVGGTWSRQHERTSPDK